MERGAWGMGQGRTDIWLMASGKLQHPALAA